MAKFVAIYGSLMFLAAFAAGIIALFKRRDPSYWASVSFIFPPAALFLLLMARNEGPRPRRLSIDEQEERDLRRDGSNSFL